MANAPGNTSRGIHFLEELFYDNEKRGLLTNITRQLPGAERMEHRDIREMTVMWRHYRYLRSNPSLLSGMARIQEYVSDLPVYQVPKQRVPADRAAICATATSLPSPAATRAATPHTSAWRTAIRVNGVLRFPARVVQAAARPGG